MPSHEACEMRTLHLLKLITGLKNSDGKSGQHSNSGVKSGQCNLHSASDTDVISSAIYDPTFYYTNSEMENKVNVPSVLERPCLLFLEGHPLH